MRKLLYFIFIAIIIGLVYYLYKCHTGGMENQRKWPTPNITKSKKTILLSADSILEPGTTFIMKKTLPANLSIFKSSGQKEITKNNAIKFFKEHFGLSDLYLGVAMVELRVNDKLNYHAKLISDERSPTGIIDGGYAVVVPKGKKLHGKYGGKNGVSSHLPGILAYGNYVFNDGSYVIEYTSTCPMTKFQTYDGDYTPIDCDIKILDAKNKSLIGLKGKAKGLFQVNNLKDGGAYNIIRNVLNFY